MHIDMGTIGAEHALPAAPQAIDHHQIGLRAPDGTVERQNVYRITNRGGKGVRTMNITQKTGALVAIESVNDDNDLVIINRSGITIRVRVADIRVMGRAAQGVRVINLEKRGDVIASVCCVDTDPDEEHETDTAEMQAEVIEEAVDDMMEDISDDIIPDDDEELTEDHDDDETDNG